MLEARTVWTNLRWSHRGAEVTNSGGAENAFTPPQ